jgi:hypothetical protein
MYRQNFVTFLFVGFAEKRSWQKKVATRGELLARILDPAAHVKRSEDQLRRKTRGVRTELQSCTKVDSGILEHCEL